MYSEKLKRRKGLQHAMKVYNNRHFQITFILLFILFMFPKKRAPPGRSPKRKARKARKARTITKVRSSKN